MFFVCCHCRFLNGRKALGCIPCSVPNPPSLLTIFSRFPGHEMAVDEDEVKDEGTRQAGQGASLEEGEIELVVKCVSVVYAQCRLRKCSLLSAWATGHSVGGV